MIQITDDALDRTFNALKKESFSSLRDRIVTTGNGCGFILDPMSFNLHVSTHLRHIVTSGGWTIAEFEETLNNL